MADAINRTGNHRANLLDINSFAENTASAQAVCNESDLLVIHRYLYGEILTAIQYWKARDKKVIIDFDQAVNYLTDDMPAYAFWFGGVAFEESSFINPPPIEQFKWGLSLVDAATVPSDRLADDWSRYANIHKVPDYINASHYPALHQDHENEIWIGVGSHAGHDCFEKSGLKTAMENVCHKYPQVKFVLRGADINPGLFDIAPTQLITHSTQYFEWADTLPGLDIGIMPIYRDYDLRLGYFDLLEFMISKIPWIASGVPIFRKFSQYGQWTQNTPTAWENSILNTEDQLQLYQRRANEDPFLFALSQEISVNIDKILKVYANIINH
jgi:hypothetical protein